jgi:hypothetical protein
MSILARISESRPALDRSRVLQMSRFSRFYPGRRRWSRALVLFRRRNIPGDLLNTQFHLDGSET